MSRFERGSLPSAIDEYAVIERLSPPTAYAEVFKATGPRGTVVCLKRIRPEQADSVEFVSRFEGEVRLAEQLEHINIVRVFDHGHDEGPYYVMEWIDGVDLESLFRAAARESAGPLPGALVAYLGVELCRALAYVHRSEFEVDEAGRARLDDAGHPVRRRGPVIHGDLSPSNILLSRQGFVKLADFGLARSLGRTGAKTLTEASGKPMYWSPEQFAGGELGVETDLFSLGLVLWQALVGTHPYAEGRPRGRALNDWIEERTLEAATARRAVVEAAPDAHPTLQRVIEGLLQPAERRIGSAQEIFETLRPIEPLDGHAQLAGRVARAVGG